MTASKEDVKGMTPVEETEASLAAIEEQLAAAAQRRDALTADLQRVNARADARDKAARLELGPLNKQINAAGHLVVSLTRERDEAPKMASHGA